MEPEEYETIYRLEASHWWYVGMRDISLALLEGVLPRREGLSILDAGCGTGGMLLALARYGPVVGLDFSPHALAFCRRRRLSRALQGSVVELPFRDGAFDLVTCFDVLYHLGVADDAAVLTEFSRVLRPGGHLLLRLPAFELLRSAHDAMVHTRHRYTRGEVRAKVAAAGFQVRRLTYANTLLFPVAAAARILQRLLGRAEERVSDVRAASPLVNTLLRAPLALEARLLPKVPLPLGLSVVCLAQKPG
ncbi:MAG: methyltransferase domain-containing protein [Chloroflexi bacterium]|nr:methyltransferase domain-containing protein [Chloroflexota bacterium]